MRSSRIVYYLLLALIGISGCASTDRRYYSAVASSAPAPIVRVLPLTANPTSTATAISPQLPAIIETPKTAETVAPPPMPKPQPAPFVAKSDRNDSREKSAPTIAKAATRSTAAERQPATRTARERHRQGGRAAQRAPPSAIFQRCRRAPARAPVHQPIFSKQQELFSNIASALRQVHADHRQSVERRRIA